MRRNLLATGLAALAVLGSALPANAHLGRRICDMEHGEGDDSNVWLFDNGDWTNTFSGRDCTGHDGAPTSGTVRGTYFGNPCTSAVLTGDAAGVITGGVGGVTHAGPATGFIAIDSAIVFTGGICDPISLSNLLVAYTEQAHIVND